MKITKTLLTAAVLTTITGSAFATTTTLPENASDQYARTTYFGKGNTTEDTTLTERSTVIGSLNTIRRATSMTTIIGDSNSVDGKNNTVIGSINIVQGHDSVVIGTGAQAGASVVPDGDDAPLLTLGSAEGHGVTVIGTNALANTEYASAIGYAAQSLGKNSISLGSYSDAGEMHAADSKYAGVSNNKGVLSIGAKDPGSTLNYSNPTVKEPWANDFTRQIQHVSAGEVSATSTDAINGSQLQDAFDRSATNANNIATNAANIIKAKTSVTAGNGVTVTDSTNTDGSTNYEVAVAKALTDQVEANKNGIDGLNGRVGKNADAIQANADAIRDLQVGVTAAGTDVTGKGPIKVRRSMALNGGSTFEVSLDQSVTNQIKANTDGINGLDGKIGENVKAIDGLKSDVAAAIDTLKGDVVKAKTTVTGSGVVEVTSSANENGSTNYNVSVNTDGIREIAKTSNRYAGDDVVKVERWNNPTGGADLTTFKFDAEKAAEKINVAYNVGGTAHTTTAAKGLGFVDGNHITTTTDANGNIQFNLDASVTDGIATNANDIKANADAIKATNDTVAGLSTKVADNTKAIKANADGVKANADAITGLDTKVADNAKAIKTNADGVKANAEAIKAHDVAINTLQGDVVKAKTTVTAGNGTVVTTTTNPNGSTNYTLGLDKGVTDQIDNNSKGIQANAEAIKDLAKANNALATETAKGLNGLNGRVDSLASKVDANQKEARRGIASATALAALHPLDYNPEHKVDVMAGVGHYRGNTAVALGAAYRPNENVMFTVGASINGKDSAINAGVSYKVGTKDGVDYKYSKIAMQRHIDELNTTVAEQNQKIEQLNNLVEKLLEEVHQSK